MLNTYDVIPFKALVYLTGQCYYGGKVTDDWDRRVLNELLKTFYNEDVVDESNYTFSAIEEYCIPEIEKISDLDVTIDFIENELPDIFSPELFGLHQSAAISSATHEQEFMIDCLLLVNEGKGKGSGDNQQNLVL